MDSSGNVAYEVIREVYVQDTTNPNFTPIGDQEIEAGVYLDIDWSLLITDATDNSFQATYVYEEVDEIDYNTPGRYLVVVSVTDDYNNQALNFIYVTVIDTTKPEFDVISEFSLDEDLYETYDWLNLVSQVTDNSDLPVYIYVASDPVKYHEPGTYIVTIIAYDSSYNFNAKTIEVTINDITPPDFDPITDQTIEVGGLSTIDWRSLITNATDNYSTQLHYSKTADNVDYLTVGTYEIKVRVADQAGNYQEVSFNVNVVDTQPPTFALIANQTIEIGAYNDFDWRVLITNTQDNSTSNLIHLEVEDNVDYNALGTYSVTVRLIDESDNYSDQTFLVTVVDTTKPLVSLNPSIDSMMIGSTYTDYGVTVQDATETIIYISGSVNTGVAGTYILTYVVIDEANNITTKKRIVTVYDSRLPVTFVLGSALTTIKVGDNYLDGICTVLIGNLEFPCMIKENTVNNQVSGIYTITYFYIYRDIEYTYQRYVFVIDEDQPIILYSPYRKEEGEEI